MAVLQWGMPQNMAVNDLAFFNLCFGYIYIYEVTFVHTHFVQ